MSAKVKPLEVVEAELNLAFALRAARCTLPVLEAHFPGGEADVVASCSAAQLLVEEVVAAVHKTKDTVVTVDSQILGMQIFDAAAGPGSASMTAAQLAVALKDEKVVLQVKLTEANDLTRLLTASSEKLVEFVLKVATAPEDRAAGQCSRADWQALLRRIRAEKTQYFRQVALLKTRHYNGMGLTPGGATSTCGGWVPLCNAGNAGDDNWALWLWRNVFWRGYWTDFAYHAANNHPVGVMFFSDPLHPFSTKERRADFAASFCTSFFGTALMLMINTDSFVAKFFISALFVTVPAAIIQKICYYLFAQPCLMIDRSKSGGCKECCVDGCGTCATGMGMAIVCVWATVFFVIGLVMWLSAEAADLLFWLTGLAQFWFLWFLNKMAIQFYPFRCGLPVVFLLRKLTCGLMPFGQWHKEREAVLSVIRDKIQARGRFHFATPGSPREAESDAQASGPPGSPTEAVAANAMADRALPEAGLPQKAAAEPTVEPAAADALAEPAVNEAAADAPAAAAEAPADGEPEPVKAAGEGTV